MGWPAGAVGNTGPWPQGGWGQALTTTIFPLGTKKIAGVLNQYISPNFPIQSAHSGGANLLRTDGGVRFVSDSINYPMFQMLVTPDDRQVVGEF